MKVDEDDVPLLIQHMYYWYANMSFEVEFFNGKSYSFCSDYVCPSIGLMQKNPTRMQWLEAENNITKLALKKWKEINDANN